MSDNTTDESEHCQQAIVFRYVLGGKVFERFWGFFNPENQNAEGLAECITEQLKLVLHDDNEKLIAQTYDGAAAMSGESGGVQEILKKTYINAHFSNCYAHKLNLVIEKAASRNPQARIFFSSLAGVSAYFSKSSSRLAVLEEVSKKNPRDAVFLNNDEGLNNFIEIVRDKQNKLPSFDDEEYFPPQKMAKFCSRNNIIAAKEVYDIIVCQVEERFRLKNHMSVAKLFFPFMYNLSYSKNFLWIAIEETVKAYPMLNKQRLNTELHVLYKLPEFKRTVGLYKIYNLILDTGIQNSLTEVFSLLKIIITTPMPTAEPERCFSTLKRLKSFLRNSMGQDRLTALAMISIEKVMIEEIPDFNKKVIDKFVQLKNRRLEFNFK
ncbi:uncharacterized protein LOC143910071 [Arctopsyche grandis]|uniref:uncharacterized protein LOC143910071 n=1 Tax=Arctopsyche grandis TaxID=121162 RepID=UPI00406D814D